MHLKDMKKRARDQCPHGSSRSERDRGPGGYRPNRLQGGAQDGHSRRRQEVLSRGRNRRALRDSAAEPSAGSRASGGQGAEPRLERERPSLGVPRPHEKGKTAQRERGDTEHDDPHVRRRKDEDPTCERDERRQRVEPHPIWTRHVRSLLAQQDESEDLPHELHQNARNDERIDHRAEREETGNDRERPKYEQRYIGEILGRMQAAERPEEIPTLGRGERNSRVTEEKGEDGAERGPEHEEREDRRDARAVQALHEDRDDEIRLGVRGSRHERPPWHHANDREVDSEIDHRDRGGADQDRSRDHAPRVPYL